MWDAEGKLPVAMMHADSVQVEFAEELLQRHLVAAARELAGAGSFGGTIAAKERIRVLLSRIHSCLRGVQSCLPDFLPVHELQGVPLAMKAKVGQPQPRKTTIVTIGCGFVV